MLPQLLTVEEVARALAVTPKRVYELKDKGLLPHVKLGRQVRFNLAKLEEFLNAGGAALPGEWKHEKDAA